ncbi:Translation elongation factor P Lys34:lysine transferase [Labilithrix luteola]|uniref:Translation elongation factor P Lys34:lysine transferase n=1 Tax=Labilithrix luteola TaxID=1391654 RepID=A0A0K1QBX6_9BACT|nr:EF-P lysine aminoacylase EpmA [Labilithrix luteola]AKV03223.1 Translation elongation factor P Lys34:lysine transferase [Labilithrix luteola]
MKLLAARAKILAQTRAFFEGRGYMEVETPLAVPCPGLDVHLDAFEAVPTGIVVPEGTPPRYLITSPEYQMKRLLAEGHGRIFQITRAFRAGELGSRHNPEFTILEFYRPHAGVEAIMRDTEQLVARVTGGWVRLGDRTIDVRPPIDRLTIVEAYRRFAGIEPEETLRLAEHDEDRFYRLLVDVVEPALAKLDRAVFVTEYPATQASLARKKPSDPRVAERFELYVAGVELCNGFGELTDAREQRARFLHDQAERTRLGKPVYPIDERFLEALAKGMPDSGGNAIGFDRLVALACGTTSIRDVMAFAADEL